MRLQRLELARYGHFSDQTMDFGERGDGPDLHVIYGPNEAGKSTILNGFLDLLYGMQPQSPYGFLHPYATMRVAAVLEIDGAAREVVRLKKASNSLVDASGRALPEAVISGALGGIGRDAYRGMFSLDDESLEGGGKAILDSRGDFGELLFSASAGLADLGRRLVDIRASADGFYRFRAHSGDLLSFKTTLARLKAERETIDMGALEYVRLVEDREATAARYEEAATARGHLQARLDAVSASLGALPRLSALRLLRSRLSTLSDRPEPPPGWFESAPVLAEELVELTASQAAVDAEIGRFRTQVEALAMDEKALAAEPRLARLVELRPRADTAGQDLPRSRLALREEEIAIAGTLAKIGRAADGDPRQLLLPIPIVSALRTAIEARSGIVARLDAADTARGVAETILAGAGARLAESGAAVGDGKRGEEDVALKALVAAERAVRASDQALRARTAARAAAKCQDDLTRQFAALAFAGEMEDLQSARVPTLDAIAAWRVREAALAVEGGRLAAEETRLSTELSRLEGERRFLHRVGMTTTDREVAEARAERERTWAEHRARLDVATADGFEVALRRDDLVGAARAAGAADRAQWRQIEEGFERAAGAALTLDRERERLAVRHADHEADLAEVWREAGAGDVPRGGTAALEMWLAQRSEVLGTRAHLEDTERQGREATEDGLALGSALRQALVRAGVSFGAADDLDILLARARTRLDADAEVRILRAALRERERELLDKREIFEKAQRADSIWKEAWSRACASCWLREARDSPDISIVREMLDELAILAPILDRRDGWLDRITKMERDAAIFAQEADAVARLAGEPHDDGSPLVLAARISSRIASAVETRKTLMRLTDALDDALARRRTILKHLEANARRRSEMMGFFGVSSTAEVEARLAEVEERARLNKEAEDVGRDILAMLGSDDLAQAEIDLDGADREGLTRERAELKLRREDEDTRCQELFAKRRVAVERVEAIGGDAQVATIEAKRRTVLLEIEDGALKYLRLRAGVSAMDQALRLYKESHRSSMLDKASEAFVTMSGGAYSGLKTQPWKDRETLIAISRDGSTKEADQLSKGTRFQLYLSLRAAGYLEYAGIRTPPPFVADDIMETFDDFRAEKALRIFARMAKVGQVVYLTHHRHLLPIAQTVCPGVTIHELERPRRPAAQVGRSEDR